MQTKKGCFTWAVVAAIGVSVSTLQAQISSSGDVTPAPTSPSWVGASINATIGDTGSGSLTIESGGTVSIRNMTLGRSAGAMGNLSMSGGNFTLSGTLGVGGASGNGSADFSGGVVSVSFIRLGNSAGSNGTMTISDTDFSLTSPFSSNFLVGVNGSASLTISGNSSLKMGVGGIQVGTSASGTGSVKLLGGVITGRNIIQGPGSGTVLIDGGTFQLSGTQNSLFSGFSAGEFIFGDAGATIDTQSFAGTSSTVLSGNGSLVKTGTGTLTLSGANAYLGNTTVSAGTLLVANTTGSGTGSGDIAVAAGAAFGGSGAISGNLSVAGILAPGGASAVSSMDLNNVSFTANGTLAINIDSGVAAASGADLAVLNGDLEMLGATYLGVTDIDATPTAIPIGTKFAIVNYTGTWNGGLFTVGTELADGDTFTVGLNTWEIDYNDTVGGDNFTGDYLAGSFITLTAVPEPSALGLAAAAAGLFGVRHFRRRARSATTS